MKRYILFFVLLFHAVSDAVSLAAGPVDVVYTWVDGQDPAWQQARDAWLPQEELLLNKDSASKNKYRNRDELKYSMRSLATYAPWINHIYIVTFGQVPKWLKEHPKITIVDHQEIFAHPEDLPTFCSIAIESNLHRIPNLSEQYLYFNDDIMLADYAEESDFFTEDGKMILALRESYSARGEQKQGELASKSGWKRTNALLDEIFFQEERHTLGHSAFATLKSVVEDLETSFPEVFRANSALRFRKPENYALVNALIPYYAYYTDRAVHGSLEWKMAKLVDDPKRVKAELEFIKKHPFKVICMEDLAYEDCPKVDALLATFLEKKYPDKAPWEI